MSDPLQILAPENFSQVESGVYRSAFPRSKNTGFLKALRLKSVVSLVPEDYPSGLLTFYENNGIRLISFGVDGNKWPFKEIDGELMKLVLAEVMRDENKPLLIHCNKGKHRTGSVIGCLRKCRGWSLSSIFTEYLLFASPKFRYEDQIFIETFDIEDSVVKFEHKK